MIFSESLNTNDDGIKVISFYANIEPIPDARTIYAVTNTKIKDGFWGVHQDLTHDVPEGRVRANRHGVCV